MDVAVLAYDGVFDSGLAAILDVLQGANAMRGELPQPPPAWEVTTVGFHRRIRTGAGHVVATAPVSEARGADLLLVPALAERRPEALIDHVSGPGSAAVRRLVADARERQTPVASACTGTFLLAESGVLDGRRATTSWWLAPVFRMRYPAVTVDETRMVTTSDGVTTAGAAFGHVDLALAIVRMSSPALADLVARYLVVDERPSQSAYTIPSALAQSDPTVAAFERWARLHLDEPISIGQAAQALGVSERTLQRAVQRALGTSPIRFVQDLRIEQASHLLRTTDLSLEAIARRVGYEHANTLRILLRERTGSTAGALRRR
ncbi:helix-turn-helix domain-containing protein [Streptomyces sp. NBC_01142]|uniref:GlxA family transcriptional regulator n=1 Tax=Streptomyces sp. NBC_01142 TaxID=2975865 RepID=UPI0022594C23|nr:helix-turn-helix domain-containing protein [Streptomyces sp. NBC_01142]MCX4820960.1 helix-turn-helix domain-containing protein [Streptomyces sp. NBC_01142]